MVKPASRALILVGICFGVVLSACGGDADLREAKDRAEIEHLMWRYARALDTSDAEAYASVYTEDGQFVAGGNATQGREALRNMIAGFKQRNDERRAAGETVVQLYHMNADTYIEFLDADHARHNTYWLTLAAGTGQENPPRVLAAGHGVDELVRVDGAWLIESRDVAPQDTL